MNINEKNLSITMRRGDSESITIHPTSALFNEGDLVTFTVRQEQNTPIILQKKVLEFEENGDAIIEILPEDTETLMVDTYVYDIEYRSAAGQVTTLVPNDAMMSLPKFKLTGDVTYE